MKQKKILLLGGSQQQIPSIKKAKELGFYTVTCDYLPENPGTNLQTNITMSAQQIKKQC